MFYEAQVCLNNSKATAKTFYISGLFKKLDHLYFSLFDKVTLKINHQSLDSNYGSLVGDTTALPIEPQPLVFVC